MKLKNKVNTIIIFLLVSSAWINLNYLQFSSSELEIIFLDVGQGDSILIKTPANNFVLIDGGRGTEVMYQLEEFIPFYIDRIHTIIFTHPDADHIEGLNEVLQNYTVDNVFINKVYKESDIVDKTLELVESYDIYNAGLNSQTDFVIDGIKFDVLWPNNSVDIFNIAESNDLSIGLLISYENFTLFTSGDLSTDIEDSLVTNITQTVTILKVGHHGSNTSTSQYFLSKLKPKHCIIQSGKDNSYGHPSNKVIDRLEDENCKIHRTDQYGNIKLIYSNQHLYLED